MQCRANAQQAMREISRGLGQIARPRHLQQVLSGFYPTSYSRLREMLVLSLPNDLLPDASSPPRGASDRNSG